MTNPGERWLRARELFEQALDMSPVERESFLLAECGDDDDLRREVEALLRHDDSAPDDFVEPPLADPTAGESVKLAAGLRLGGTATGPGDFEIRHELGRGAMGVVYRARQNSLARDVAIKVMVANLTTTSSEVERFHREARAIAKLSHDGIVRVIADGSNGSVHWFAMELVAGHSLAREIDLTRERQSGADPRARAILPEPDHSGRLAAIAGVVADAATALAHAHDHGIVHRDIKPSNLLLTPEGKVKVVDFGIARDTAFGTMTRSDQLIGSLPYMSPEQARLLDVRVDHRTDVYSLGVVLYELLTLERPFRGATSHEVVTAIEHHEPPPVRRCNPKVPRDLATICGKAMGKLPRERYADARAFAADLRRFLDHEAILAQPPTRLDRARRYVARHTHKIAFAAATLLALGAGAYFATRTVEARSLDRALAPLRELAASADWSAMDLAEIADLRAERDRLAARDDLADADRVVLQTLDARFVDFATRRRTEGVGRIAAQLQRSESEGALAIDFYTVAGELLALSKLFPNDAPFDASVFQPRLTIDAAPGFDAAVGALVSCIMLDPEIGEPTETLSIGTLPLEGVALPTGYARIRVELQAADGSADTPTIREFTRLLAPGATLDVRIDPMPSESNEMVLIAGATLRMDDGSKLSPLEDREIRVAPFWLDKYEVSNADWRRFLATRPADYPRPVYWDRVEPGSPADRLPVSRISWEQAREYAEWLGKRLPSLAEWTLTARGVEARRFPWPGDEWRGATAGPPPVLGDMELSIRRYMESTVSTRDGAETASPDGVLHLLGNVAELTETPVSHPSAGNGVARRPRYDERYVCGHAWDAQKPRLDSTHQNDLTTIATIGTGSTNVWLGYGFRCARSATTPP